MQAHVGVTKHIGGFEATNELLSLCHIEDARQVLNVGCGIGVGPAYIAKKYDCRVVGVDISEKMIEWSRRRAREERVEDKVEFRMADVLELPFRSRPVRRRHRRICADLRRRQATGDSGMCAGDQTRRLRWAERGLLDQAAIS